MMSLIVTLVWQWKVAERQREQAEVARMEAIQQKDNALRRLDNLSRQLTDKSYISFLVSQGEKLASQDQLDQALAKYTQAQQLAPDVKIAAKSWETLCYFGNFFQQAE